MKYLLMIFAQTDSPWTGSEADVAGMLDLFTVQRELTASGELLASEGLAEPAAALTVTVSAGSPVVTDGPFAEAKEQLAGYFLLECSRERAIEVAARLSAGQDHPVQVSPVVDQEEMQAALRPGPGG